MNANANGVPTATQVALDLVLAEAAASTRERFLPGREAVRLGAALARRPKAVVRRGAHLGREISGVLGARASARGPALQRSRVVDQLGASPPPAGLPRGGERPLTRCSRTLRWSGRTTAGCGSSHRT
jgi:hypothetical protein